MNIPVINVLVELFAQANQSLNVSLTNVGLIIVKTWSDKPEVIIAIIALAVSIITVISTVIYQRKTVDKQDTQ